MAQVKLWGFKQEIFSEHGVTVDLLTISPGGFSSIHAHKILHNYFYFLGDMGDLNIEAYERIGDTNKVGLLDFVCLNSSNRSLSVEPKNLHCFRNTSQVKIQVIEVTFDPGMKCEDDILRLVLGGQEDAKETTNSDSSPFGLAEGAG